ncbi:MAG TPA: RNA polymerase sigma factor region1.1 domain-containing protein, partial [Polyangia bacterium]|nr:RNA polymerase sigma factor region1.1 domain-containing protein [Polyangia bacterium]
MDDTFDNEADTDNDDDGEEIPRVPRAAKPGAKAGAKNGAGKNGAAAAAASPSGGSGGSGGKKGAPSAKETERKKRELITMGKAKGFLTYDEVNEHMPESIVSSDQMDDWLSAFSGEGIEIVDSSSKIKVPEKGATGEAAAEEE